MYTVYMVYIISLGKRLIKFKTSLLWNRLPNESKQNQKSSFNLQLKKHMLSYLI